jgi:quinoprotein glucose dehydrogenase
LLTLRVLGASGAVQPAAASADPDVDPRGPTLGQMPPASNLPAGFVPYAAVAPYGNYRDLTMGAPPLAPPWSQITAYDLNKGTILWQVPNGDEPDLAARGVTGTGSQAARAGVVTAGGLFFIGATHYDSKFRAFDKKTGKLLWETLLPHAGNATPAVYEINGREYVAVCVGSAEGRGNTPNPTAASQYVVFALPGK